MRNYYNDKKEYLDLKKQNFNKLDTFYDFFIRETKGKVDRKYLKIIKELYNRINKSLPNDLPIGYKEFYRKYINFDHFNNDYYTIIWDIDHAKKIIKTHKLQPKRYQVNELLGLVDVETIDVKKLKKVEKYETIDPVILVNYHPFNSTLLIDGNHRVYSKKEQSDLYIDAIVLNDYLSIECMADDLFKFMYALHYNIFELANYLHGNITKNQLDKSLIKI